MRYEEGDTGPSLVVLPTGRTGECYRYIPWLSLIGHPLRGFGSRPDRRLGRAKKTNLQKSCPAINFLSFQIPQITVAAASDPSRLFSERSVVPRL